MEQFRLSSSSAKNKVLSIDSSGNISQTLPQDADDDMWMFLAPQVTGMLSAENQDFDSVADDSTTVGRAIVSTKYYRVLQYDEAQNEKLFTVSLDNINPATLTKWKLTKDGMLYTMSGKEKKYIWILSNVLYVTPDEHLAESWKIISISGHDIKETMNRRISVPIWLLIILILIMIAIGIWVYFNRKKCT